MLVGSLSFGNSEQGRMASPGECVGFILIQGANVLGKGGHLLCGGQKIPDDRRGPPMCSLDLRSQLECSFTMSGKGSVVVGGKVLDISREGGGEGTLSGQLLGLRKEIPSEILWTHLQYQDARSD